MPADRITTRTWLVWATGVAVYFLAVFNRSSLGVAGLLADQRFGISAAQLSTFTMLQLLVYAGMQIPVGLMIDRFGSRTMLTLGICVMSLAQAGFAMATTFPEALVARGLLGVGDAMTFICVLRLVSAWFPLRRVPLMTQVTGAVGYLGAIVAAVPLSAALRGAGWTPTYAGASLVGAVMLVVLLTVLADTPQARHLRGPRMELSHLRASLAASWHQPGTRLGFWVHFTTPFSSYVLGLLWGFPFFVKGEGLSDGTASTLLTVLTVGAMVGGPCLGWLAGRFPWHRSTMALGIIGAIVAAWTVVLAWPGHVPPGALVVFTFIVGIGGPASLMGFDLGRTSNPPHRLATSSGIINQGGFVASLIGVLAVGGLLDWRTPGGSAYTNAGFHWAFSFQYLLWGLGVIQILRYRRKVRGRVAREAVDAGNSMVEEHVLPQPRASESLTFGSRHAGHPDHNVRDSQAGSRRARDR